MKKKLAKLSNHEIVQRIRDERREKKIIKPGKWSNINPGFSVVAKLRKTISIVPSFPPFFGKYLTHDSNNYNGDGHQALINVCIDKLPALLKEHGIDKVLAACEKSLNSYVKDGKKVLGDLVIMKLLDDREGKEERYLTCLVKTNNKFISNFMGMKEGILKVFE